MPRASWPAMAMVLLALVATGCVRGCNSSRPPIHLNPNMDNQPRYDPQQASDFFYDGKGMRAPVEGTVARGELQQDRPFHTGTDSAGNFLTEIPPLTPAQLARGPERYAIYCEPCHDPRGLGQGILYEYGGVPTASFHDEQRSAYPPGRLFDVITNGSGLMQGYRYPIPPADRWAIVAHVQQLQRARQDRAHATSAPPEGTR
ncbi:MAG TPA: cytochrome c [Candidatus Polarisedimenticolaceae bacterium]|nr:cytochrome c [Candidatus Polarisedimenticolaceae bacterium]